MPGSCAYADLDSPEIFGVQRGGIFKGKSAIYVARHFLGKKRNYTGQAFWARGYFISTVGVNEATIREYIQRQEQEDKALDQLDFFPPKSSRKATGHDDDPRTAR